MLPAKVVEMYRNAPDYDLEYGGKLDDIPWLENLCVKYASDGQVLNLCCGTLREGIPLAKTGLGNNFSLVGVDITPEMLEQGKHKLAAEPAAVQANFSLIQGDIRSVDVGYGEFNFTFVPFNSLWHMTTMKDLLAALANAYQHLMPGGHFVADVFHPNIRRLTKMMERPSVLLHESVAESSERDLKLVRWSAEEYFPAEQVMRNIFYYWKYELGEDRKLIDAYWSPLVLRIAFPAELQLVLERVGFEVIARWGNYNNEPFGNDSPKMLFLCRKPK